MRCVIRVDSSAQIGSGHLMRCLTLARQLCSKRGAEVMFVCRELPGNLITLVREQGFQIAVLPCVEVDENLEGYAAWLMVTQTRDAEETIAVLPSGVDLLVVDSYAIDRQWEQKLRPFVKEIFVIDDLANRPHDCDVLLDQNFHPDGGANVYKGLVPEHCRMLIGPRHALLREEFYEARSHLRSRTGEIKQILVFYGGADLTDETSKAVRALVKLHGKMRFTADIIVGRSNPHAEAVRQLCEKYDYLQYHFQVRNMAEYMAGADLMLGAGGTTTWERCYLGLPAIVTSIADNQHEGSRIFAEAGYNFYLGRAEDVLEDDIESAILQMTPIRLRAYRVAGEQLMGVGDDI